METTKLVLLFLLFSMFYQTEASNELDSLKNIRTKYLVGDLNEDCFKDTVYGKIINSVKMLPDFIIWGKYDSTVVCDTNRSFNYDSTNVEFTSIIYDTNNIRLISISTRDYTNDYINDLSYSVKTIDSLGSDTVNHLLIIGDNDLSKNSMIYIYIDSLAIDTLNCIIPNYETDTEVLKQYGTYCFQVIDILEENPIPQIQTQTSVNEPPKNKYLVYPNPNKGELNISVDIPPYSIEISNIKGEKIFQLRSISQSKYLLDISHFINGVYFVKLKGENSSKIFKIIKSN